MHVCLVIRNFAGPMTELQSYMKAEATLCQKILIYLTMYHRASDQCCYYYCSSQPTIMVSENLR